MNVEINRRATAAENVSHRVLTYDIYVNGRYDTTVADILDALDYKEKLEAGLQRDTAVRFRYRDEDGAVKVGSGVIQGVRREFDTGRFYYVEDIDGALRRVTCDDILGVNLEAE